MVIVIKKNRRKLYAASIFYLLNENIIQQEFR